MTSMPAKGFLSSWAIAAAISPSAARRSRRRSRSSMLLDVREVLEEQRNSAERAVLVANVRQRVADHAAPWTSSASRHGSADAPSRRPPRARAPCRDGCAGPRRRAARCPRRQGSCRRCDTPRRSSRRPQPSLVTARTPFRMLETMSRKNRSSTGGGIGARRRRAGLAAADERPREADCAAAGSRGRTVQWHGRPPAHRKLQAARSLPIYRQVCRRGTRADCYSRRMCGRAPKPTAPPVPLCAGYLAV